MPRRGRNRVLRDNFQRMRQFVPRILCGRLSPHNPPALDREPLSQPVEGMGGASPATAQSCLQALVSLRPRVR